MDFKIWTKKDETQIPVKEMSTLHIKNTINMLKFRVEQNEAVQEFMNKTMDLLDSVIPVEEQIQPKFNSIDKSFVMGVNSCNKGIVNFKKWIETFEEELKKRETN